MTQIRPIWANDMGFHRDSYSGWETGLSFSEIPKDVRAKTATTTLLPWAPCAKVTMKEDKIMKLKERKNYILLALFRPQIQLNPKPLSTILRLCFYVDQ